METNGYSINSCLHSILLPNLQNVAPNFRLVPCLFGLSQPNCQIVVAFTICACVAYGWPLDCTPTPRAFLGHNFRTRIFVGSSRMPWTSFLGWTNGLAHYSRRKCLLVPYFDTKWIIWNCWRLNLDVSLNCWNCNWWKRTYLVHSKFPILDLYVLGPLTKTNQKNIQCESIRRMVRVKTTWLWFRSICLGLA